jgi:hypothetical protein
VEIQCAALGFDYVFPKSAAWEDLISTICSPLVEAEDAVIVIA